MKTLRAPLLLIGFLLLPRLVTAAPDPARPLIYDESADGAQQIAAALSTAEKEHKQVLLQFGANWCIWCHRLHDLMAADAALHEELKAHYVVVLVDVNQGRNADTDAKYGHPTSMGLPALAVLDAGGNLLTIKDSGELEQGDHHDPQKVMAFLKQWAPGH